MFTGPGFELGTFGMQNMKNATLILKFLYFPTNFFNFSFRKNHLRNMT